MILSIVGPSGSGKTTLITKLVPILKKAGLRVAVVKKVHEDFEIDKEGKDSHRIFCSGADIAIFSSKKLALIKRAEDEDLDSIVVRYLPGYDLILTEGFRDAKKPRIVFLNHEDEIDMYGQGEILAVICDKPVDGFLCFRRDEVERIADFILSLLKSKKFCES
ncbi:MAG: molybdopterin-guanine dinucleotide biosynthesis protein B [Archaeoglobales archaeon]|nr:molybdopterin-guanine dinucleotide biosynthesis protein B [Archaeoglobales archaeon]